MMKTIGLQSPFLCYAAAYIAECLRPSSLRRIALYLEVFVVFMYLGIKII
jgi:hypothetical protein